jgi:hypothetical protein
MKEASDLLGKMKDMPGMGDMQSRLEKMGMGGALGGRGGGGGKLNLGAMTNKLNQDMKKAQTREKALQRATVRQAELEQIKKQQQMMAELPPTKQLTEAELEELVFSIEGDKPEKSMRNDNTANKKKKKKGKK